jgi:hypothetical protein
VEGDGPMTPPQRGPHGGNVGGGAMTSRGWCGGSGTEEPRSNDVDSGDRGMGQAVEGAGSAPTRDPHARKVKGVGGGDRDARAPTSK